jgi:hypothetical protein
MPLASVVLLALSAGFLILGLIESFRFGLANGYWAFMISIALLFAYAYRKWNVEK